MNTSTQRGARARTSKRAPSIDLVTLIELLTKSIPPDSTAVNRPASWSLFDYSRAEGRLKINTRGVLSRLFQQEGFSKEFQPGEETGFIRDADLPPKGIEAKIGGRILAERVQDLSHAVTTFKSKLEEELETFCQKENINLSDLVSERADEYLQQLSQSVGARLNVNTVESEITPIQFADPDRASSKRYEDVARLIAAVEQIETRDWLDNFEKPARRKLVRRGLDEDEIDGVIDNFRREAQRLDSQTIRFLNFLDDEALARVRLEVTFAIMRAVKEATRKRSDEGARLLVRFIENVETIKDKYFETEEQLVFDVSGRFGGAGKVNLSDFLRKALFYRCLSVWPQWETQMFEFRPIGGGSLAREISYRFRVNGFNPKGQTAFQARTSRYREELANPSNDELVRRLLAELAFLMIVVPKRDSLEKPSDPANIAEQFVRYIQRQDGNPIDALIKALENKAEVMDLIAEALVQTLRSRGDTIVNVAERQIEELSVCVQEDIIDWDRLSAATGSSSDFFIRPSDASQDEKIQWFKHIVITGNPSTVPGLLFSVKVKTMLRERALTKAGASYKLPMQRQLSGLLLPVMFQPYGIERDGDAIIGKPVDSLASWKIANGIDIQVYEDTLTRRPISDKPPELVKQRHAASTTAFAVLIYTLLWLIRDCIGKKRPDEKLRYLILRAQRDNKAAFNDDPDAGLAGTESLYAITQAIELALACEGPAFMQGMSLANANRFRDDGVFAAFVSAFPLALECPTAQTGPMIGLINYSTRPCSSHPQYPDEEVYLYTAKTYIAVPCKDTFKGHVLCEDKTQLHIQPKDAFEEPSLIFEEIGRLRDMGCHHIMLLWQHYGNRRIGRTADRHAPHSHPEFLERVAEKFPDITLYSLRRDVFPAVRMPKEGTKSSAYEVTRVREHEDFWHPAEKEIRRDIVPVYTFATLFVVGSETDRPQSGFCTYFLEADSRLSNAEWAERARTNLIDPNQDSTIRPALISVLRGLHYLHAEKGVQKGFLKPKLDPHHWIAPTTVGGAGELKVMSSRRRGSLVISFPAVLAHVSTILRGGKK